MVDFVFVDRRLAELDVHEHVDGVEADGDGEVDDGWSVRGVIRAEDSSDDCSKGGDQ